jgi:glycosyltransferase involved in cell wall biosynthesis
MERGDRLKLLQLGMHERGSGGGVDHFFWDLFDQLGTFPELSLSAFFFRHRSEMIPERPGEVCLGSSRLFGGQRLWKLRRAVLEKLLDDSISRPTVIVSHFAMYASALLPQLKRWRHVVHFQGPWATESATEGKGSLNVRIKRMIEDSVYSSANAFITLSQAFKQLLVAEYQVDSSLVHVIPPAVDLKRFTLGDRQAARDRLGWSQDGMILLCVRRLARRMGLEALIEAFRQVASCHPRALLFLGGTGALRNELLALIDTHGLKDRVRLLGFIPDEQLATAYQAADLSIVPSQSLEGFGLTTLESMACGTPVLVTPVGGLPEAVNGLSAKLVLPDRTIAALAGGLDAFLAGRLPMPSASQCRRHVEKEFAWSKIALQVKNLYQQVAYR